MRPIKNVTAIGASGTLGAIALKKLLEAGKFNVTVIRRAGSTSTFPANVKVIDVDYSSLASLKSAFQGQDAVISFVPTFAADAQKAFVDAAIESGVSRFIPSEFSANLANPKARTLPTFIPKVKLQEYLIEKAKGSGLTYTFIYGGGWLDAGSHRSFLISSTGDTTNRYDGGDVLFSASTLDTVADAILSTLDHLEETRNRAVHVHSLVTTQNRLLALAKEVAPEKSWDTVDFKLDDLIAKSDTRLAKGITDFETFAPYILRAIFDPDFGAYYEKTDNELLGIKEASDQEVREIIRNLLKH
ncbi:aromatic alcohol reductase [Aspergillus homomorphus CBS 101889]|uniref:NmrA-like family protein n=1 Tax=Aspergillus homomorphus (strain CBS 101889) TaxID=1450537 RepID=A0A395HKV6_ASPHC|nr:NmrA-like family protein [Aspergillus homomorphus CBS 101889]RAL08043.1 NmrA-like family protein [Aspergillus homomorphus CBS 101889]